jgi:hypothetical protein
VIQLAVQEGMRGQDTTFAEIRRLVVTAAFSDDRLLEKFVLKGGNALTLVHELNLRSSLDIDLSMDSDFEDQHDAKFRLFRALDDRFDSAGFVIFDKKFEPKPPPDGSPPHPRWGGYQVEFKMLPKSKYEAYRGDLDRIRREATVIGPMQRRIFRIEISKHEYCGKKSQAELDDYTIYVYTPAMIAIEKLRAICQQTLEYPLLRTKRGRARDFFDIFVIVTEKGIDLGTEENLELIRHIFSAKDVPLDLLQEIRNYREFHRPDWISVENSVSTRLLPFDFYFDFVLRETEKLKSLGVE